MNTRMMTTDDFLRDKTRTTREYENTVIDIATGEIISQEKSVTKIRSTEPDYIKVYYKTMMAVNEISEIPLDFLLALSSQIGFANGSGDKILYYNNKTTRRAISNYCNIGDNMTAKYIKRAVDKGILFTTQDRGTYEVNPWLIAKGKWEHIKELQANFTFLSGKWQRIVTLESDKNNEIPAPEEEPDKEA